MAYVPETYEERADVAEHQAATLETMIYKFVQESKDCDLKEVPGLLQLRDDWKDYCEQR